MDKTNKSANKNKSTNKNAKKKSANKGDSKGGVRPKPRLTKRQGELLKLKLEMARKRPNFRRQEYFRYKRLGTAWRKPRGLHSKLRKEISYRPARVKVGYRGPREVRGLHPSGFKEVLVHNLVDLEGVDPKSEAIRIGGSVGTKKRVAIEKKAKKMGIRVLNPLHREKGNKIVDVEEEE